MIGSLRDDNKIFSTSRFALSNLYCRGVPHKKRKSKKKNSIKQRFGTILLSAPTAYPPQKRKLYFYCRLAVSEWLEAPKRVKTKVYQKVNVSKLKKLAILTPVRFDTPLGAVKGAPKRVPKQTGTKMPSFKSLPFWKPSVLTPPWVLLRWYSWWFAIIFLLHAVILKWKGFSRALVQTRGLANVPPQPGWFGLGRDELPFGALSWGKQGKRRAY